MTRFCHQCGTQVQEGQRYCNKCGTMLSATQPTTTAPGASSSGYQQPPNYGQYPAPPPYQPQAASELKPNVAGMLCYPLSIVTGVLFLVLTPYNRDRFVKFHAYQAIFLFVALIILRAAFGILPWWLEGLMLSLLRLAALGGTAFLMFKAYQGEKFKLPLIGDLADQQAAK